MLALLAAVALQGAPPQGPAVAPQPAPEVLLAALSDRRRPLEERMAALEQLALLDGPLPLEPLLQIQSLVRDAWLADYARALSRTGAGALDVLRKIHRRGDTNARAEATYGIVRLDEDGGEDFARGALADAKEPPACRVAALRALADRGSPFARVEALRRLATAEGPLLLEAIAVLRRRPDLEDVPYLVDVLRERSGRSAGEAHRLLQDLTGYRLGPDPKLWEYWMLKHRAEGTPFRREPSPADESTTLSYLGVPILGERIVFVLDSSGSMNEPLPERRDRTRGQEAVEELVRLLPRLPASARFDIVFFADGASQFGKSPHGGDGLMARTEEQVQSATGWLRQHRFEGGTNLLEGLVLAFGHEAVEEIVLLSDGEPTVGEVSPARILAAVARWNRWRSVRVSTISLGAPPPARSFLARLAAQNGGTCRVLD